MRPLRQRIRDAARKQGVPQEVVEKDYALSYLLAGIYSIPELEKALVFKGGTALKKLFFGDYRFSEDLDFSANEFAADGDPEAALGRAIAESERLLSQHGPFSINLERYMEREPHPHGQDAFIIRVRFPWQPRPLCRIKVEITHDELILMEPQQRHLLHGYGEELHYSLPCYPLEEIVAEKMRALLQTHLKLVERGWNRPRARDYYDLWRILNDFSEELDKALIRRLLERKSSHRLVTYEGIDDFFTIELLAEADRHWESSLGPFVVALPEFDAVVEELKLSIDSILVVA